MSGEAQPGQRRISNRLPRGYYRKLRSSFENISGLLEDGWYGLSPLPFTVAESFYYGKGEDKLDLSFDLVFDDTSQEPVIESAFAEIVTVEPYALNDDYDLHIANRLGMEFLSDAYSLTGSAFLVARIGGRTITLSDRVLAPATADEGLKAKRRGIVAQLRLTPELYDTFQQTLDGFEAVLSLKGIRHLRDGWGEDDGGNQLQQS